MYNHPYMGFPQFVPPIPSSEEAWKLYKRIKKMEKQDKGNGGDDKKKDDKKTGGFKSPFNTVQWLVLTCFFGPIVTPWFILGVITSWQTAAMAIKASFN